MILYDMKLNLDPFQHIFQSETLKMAPYDCKQNVPITFFQISIYPFIHTFKTKILPRTRIGSVKSDMQAKFVQMDWRRHQTIISKLSRPSFPGPAFQAQKILRHCHCRKPSSLKYPFSKLHNTQDEKCVTKISDSYVIELTILI